MKTNILMIIFLISGICSMAQDTATVQIGTQRWHKFNLNVGIMLPATAAQTNNNIVEKHCYNNDEQNCTTYGGLYLWDEMMKWTIAEGAQGICPDGFRVATDEDWAVLIAYYGGTQIAGESLKEAGFEHWQFPLQWDKPWYPAIVKARMAAMIAGINTDGFSARGSGYKYGDYYTLIKQYGYFWTSTTPPSGWKHFIDIHLMAFVAHFHEKYPTTLQEFPVRCIKN